MAIEGIKKVREAEEEAHGIVGEASRNAERLLKEAEDEAAGKLAAAGEEAEREGARIREALGKEADRETKAIEEGGLDECRKIRDEAGSRIDKAVKEVLDIIRR